MAMNDGMNMAARAPFAFADNAGNAGYLDGLAGRMRHCGLMTDNTGQTDSIAGRFVFRGVASDALAPTDGLSGVGRYRGSVSDTLGMVDWIPGMIGTYLADVDDALALDDLVARTVQAAIYPLPYAFGDNYGAVITDSMGGLYVFRAQPSDAVSLTDNTAGQLNYRGVASDSASYTDLIAGLMRDLVTPSDSFTMSDLVTYEFSGRLDYSNIADDYSAVITDNIGGLLVYRMQVSDAVGVTDSMAEQLGFSLGFGDEVTCVDLVAGLMRCHALMSDTLGLADFIESAFVGQLKYSAIGDDYSAVIADGVDGLSRYLGAASDACNSSDTMSALARHCGIAADDIGMSDVAGGLQRFRCSAADSLSSSDAVALRGWGITADKTCTTVRLYGSDIRPVNLVGGDIRPVNLVGGDIRPIKLRGE